MYGGKNVRSNIKESGTSKIEKKMQQVGPSLKVTLFSHYTYLAYTRVSKGYYNELLLKQWLWNT